MDNNITNTKINIKNCIYLPSCHSTNDYINVLIANNSISNNTIVYTDCQTKGRGQQGSSWYSEPYKNLTCSIYHKTIAFKNDSLFHLSILVSESICHVLNQFYSIDCKIKWPNDIYIIENSIPKKIGGILIENKYRSEFNEFIIGIGINVNQSDFAGLNASSLFCILNIELSIQRLMELVYNSLLSKINNYTSETFSLEYYYQNLLFFENWCLFKDMFGVFDGKIIGINQSGELIIMKKSGILFNYKLKEIEWIFI